jgi:hypothetical protein
MELLLLLLVADGVACGEHTHTHTYIHTYIHKRTDSVQREQMVGTSLVWSCAVELDDETDSVRTAMELPETHC